MKKILFASLFTAIAGPSFAQTDKILADPDVVWVAETEFVLRPDATPEPDGGRGFFPVMVLKNMAARPEQLYSEPLTLGGILLDQAQRPGQAVFDDPDLKNRLTPEQLQARLYYLDTVTTFDPLTFQDPVPIIRRFLTPDDCGRVHVRQLLYYREKTAEFGLQTLALGLAQNDGKVLFWMPVTTPTAPVPALSDPAVVWARRIGVQNVVVELGDMKPLKQPASPFLQVFLDRVRKDAGVEIFSGKNWSRPVVGDDRENMYQVVDTIVTFDPETYEEFVRISRVEMNADYLRLGIVQDWYWDDRRKQLIIRPVAICPLMHQLDGDGNYLYSRPLFYRKMK